MQRRSHSVLVLVLSLTATAAGCNKKSDDKGGEAPAKRLGSAPAGPGAAAALGAANEAKQYFDTVCAACHGSSGKGDGPGAAALNPKPRNYSDPTWQASVTDADIAKIISEGGAAVGKSSSMPANPTLKAEVLAELVKKVRSFGPIPQ